MIGRAAITRCHGDNGDLVPRGGPGRGWIARRPERRRAPAPPACSSGSHRWRFFGSSRACSRRLHTEVARDISKAEAWCQSSMPKKYNSAMNRLPVALLFAAYGVTAFGVYPSTSSVSKIFDGQLSMIEHEVLPLAEAMPADKYSFAPTHGEFKGVRTFGQQVGHIAAVMYLVSATTLGEE